MTRPDVWVPYRMGPKKPPHRTDTDIKIDPLSFLGTILIANVLILGSITGKLPWLECACGILTKKETFIQKVQPQGTSKITTSFKWRGIAKQVGPRDEGGCGLLQRARRAQYAWGRLGVITKSNGLGRIIIDLAAFSRACARPTLINLPFIPELFRRIGSLRGSEGYMWSADLKNFFYQIPIKEFLSAYCTISFVGESFQFTTLPQGWSWAPVLAISIAYGIMLGEWPKGLSDLVDFSSLRGDTPPSFVPLWKEGKEIGYIIIWIDNIFVIATDKAVVTDIRSHFIRRAKFVHAHFKLPADDLGNPLFRDPLGQPEPERIATSAIFLGVLFKWKTDRFVWEHGDLDGFRTDVKLTAPRRDYSSVVGSLIWDATVAMEGTSKLQKSLDVIRRLTKGVNQKKQWMEIVQITMEERATLLSDLQRALLRGTISVDLSTPQRPFIFVASDASKKKIGYVRLPIARPTSLPVPEDVHQGAAQGSHIFYSELQAATWAILDLCMLHPGSMIVLAVDNSALFYVLRRMFTSTEEGRPYVEIIQQVLEDTTCDMLPVLIPGDQNVADGPSRDQEITEARTLATWRALYAAAYGGSRHLVNFGGKHPRDALERLLHEEAPVDVLDELDAFDQKDEDGELQ